MGTPLSTPPQRHDRPGPRRRTGRPRREAGTPGNLVVLQWTTKKGEAGAVLQPPEEGAPSRSKPDRRSRPANCSASPATAATHPGRTACRRSAVLADLGQPVRLVMSPRSHLPLGNAGATGAETHKATGPKPDMSRRCVKEPAALPYRRTTKPPSSSQGMAGAFVRTPPPATHPRRLREWCRRAKLFMSVQLSTHGTTLITTAEVAQRMGSFHRRWPPSTDGCATAA